MTRPSSTIARISDSAMKSMCSVRRGFIVHPPARRTARVTRLP
jgi:hypothetical protein